MAKHSKAVIQRAKHVNQIKQANLQRELSQRRFVKSQTTSKFTRFLFGSLQILLLIFLIVVIIKKTYGGGEPLTFTGFLDWLSNREDISINIDVTQIGVSGDWGIFNWLRVYFDFMAKSAAVIAWLSANVVNILLFLGQFISFLLS